MKKTALSVCLKPSFLYYILNMEQREIRFFARKFWLCPQNKDMRVGKTRFLRDLSANNGRVGQRFGKSIKKYELWNNVIEKIILAISKKNK